MMGKEKNQERIAEALQDEFDRDPNEPDYRSFHFPSNSNPYFPAEFWEDSAGVFKNIEACLLVMDATGIGDLVYDDLRHVVPRLEFNHTGEARAFGPARSKPVLRPGCRELV